MSRAERLRRLQAEADRFNATHAVGASVRYWRGPIEGVGQVGRTRTPAEVLGEHTAVVWIEGCAGCVALSHVETEQQRGM